MCIRDRNKKARHDYAIEDKYEAGLALTGTEVKSLREGRASLSEAFISIDRRGEMWLEGANIPEYLNGCLLYTSLDDIQDRTAAILDARAERRKAQRFQKRAGDAAMARANLSGATSPGGAALPGGAAASGNATGHLSLIHISRSYVHIPT